MEFYIKKPIGTSYHKNSVIWQKITVGVIGILALFLTLNIFNQRVRNAFYLVVSPVAAVFWQAGNSLQNVISHTLPAGALAQENHNLTQENQNLLSKISLLEDALRQEKLTRQVVENTKGANLKVVLAQTISFDPTQDVILLDKGAGDGIVENMPVISESKVLYGKVTQVYQNFSRVMLVSNIASVVDAKILYSDPLAAPIHGAVKGSGNFSTYLDLVSSEDAIREGDVLVTSGLEGTYPKDLLLAKITQVQKNDAKPFQTASLRSLALAKHLDTLFIITNFR